MKFERVPLSRLIEVDSSYAKFFSDPGSRFDKTGLLRQMQFFAPQPDGTAPYIFCGDKSTTALLYSRVFARSVIGKSALPSVDAEFLDFVDRDFRNVAEKQQMSTGRVELDIDAPEDKPIRIKFWRLVFPFDTGRGTAVGALTRFCEDGMPEAYDLVHRQT